MVAEKLPDIGYLTLADEYVIVSFLLLCAVVAANAISGALAWSKGPQAEWIGDHNEARMSAFRVDQILLGSLAGLWTAYHIYFIYRARAALKTTRRRCLTPPSWWNVAGQIYGCFASAIQNQDAEEFEQTLDKRGMLLLHQPTKDSWELIYRPTSIHDGHHGYIFDDYGRRPNRALKSGNSAARLLRKNGKRKASGAHHRMGMSMLYRTTRLGRHRTATTPSRDV